MYRTIDTSFTPEQDTAYHELRQRALTYIQNHEITAVNAVSLINRLLQICSGQLKIGDNKYISIQNNRLPMLLELLEETPKTIVWTSFVNTAADIMKALNGTGRSVEHGDGMPKAVQLKSGMSIKERQETLEMFKKYNIALVANPASAGHGITLIETHNVIYYSNYWSFENRIQSEFRTDRIGQTQSVLYTDLITKGTIEEYVVELLQNKRELAETIITNTMSDPRDFLLRILK
jgi:SNF2 family DNA or RNA helicase